MDIEKKLKQDITLQDETLEKLQEQVHKRDILVTDS